MSVATCVLVYFYMYVRVFIHPYVLSVKTQRTLLPRAALCLRIHVVASLGR